MEKQALKLFMVLLGSKAPGRTIEQHDFFFGIADHLEALIPQMHAFWPEASNSLHIDGWREVTCVEGYQVQVIPKFTDATPGDNRLFFINLGGYQSGRLEEQHYALLTVQPDRKNAIRASTMTTFFKESSIQKVKAAAAHIDEKYGIDVDDVYCIEDVLSTVDKERYHIQLTAGNCIIPDEIHLGYWKLNLPA